MSKYTPGPWVVRGKPADKHGYEYRYWLAPEPYYYDIMHGNQLNVGDRRIGIGNAEANATLASAAPELLAAVEGLLLLADNGTQQFDSQQRAVVAAARKAVAKALGWRDPLEAKEERS